MRAASIRSLRDPDEEVPEQEDRERQPERGVEEDQPGDRVEEPEVVVEREDRDQRHLDRHDEHRDDDDEEPVAPRELEPGERVAGERRDDDREVVAPSEIQSVVQIADVIASFSRISR